MKTFFMLLIITLFIGCQKANPVDSSTSTTPVKTDPIVSIAYDTVHNFGGIRIGQFGVQVLHISNISTDSNAILIIHVTVTNTPTDSSFSLYTSVSDYRIIPNDSVTIRVSFSPTKVGYHLGSLYIEHNATKQNSPIIIPLQGNAFLQ